MKHLLSLCLCASVFNLHAAVPLRWTVETSRVQPATFEAYQGETLTFEAALQSYGKPLAAPSEYAFYWQTNGMGSAWWVRQVSITNHPITQSSNHPISNVLYATFSPDMDCGAKVYSCFIGLSNSIYRAAFQLRLRPSPGALPNELPLPTPVIDFAKVTVLNPPWSGGGSGGVDTNAVLDIIHKTVEGSARYTPKYLWVYDCDDTYPEDAAWYYAQPQPYGSCSAVRDGGFLYRNYDWRFDDSAEFVVRVSSGTVPDAPRVAGAGTSGAGNRRFASVGVANCGTNLTESFVTSGRPSRYYKCLPGRVVDGINENGVVCEVNVVDGEPQWRSGVLTASDIHPLAAVRWALDNGTSAGMVASNLAARIVFPEGWAQNFHWMVADERETWIVENCTASNVTAVAAKRVMTNFPILPDTYSGMGKERYQLLRGGEQITNAWFTRAYSPSTDWFTDFGNSAAIMEGAKSFWNDGRTKEQHRGETVYGQSWWQTVHCSIYDITNRTLRIAVQEQDDWYVFALPGATGVSPVGVDTNAVKSLINYEVGGTNALKAAVAAIPGLSSSVSSHASQLSQLSQAKRGKTDLDVYGDVLTDEWTCVPDISPYRVQRAIGVIAWRVVDTNGNAASVEKGYDEPLTEELTWESNESALGFKFVATRVHGTGPTGDTLATSNGVNAAIAANEATGTDRQVVRGNFSGNIWGLYVGRSANSDAAGTVEWMGIENTPTTLSGYGITDAQSKITASGLLKGDGEGNVTAATPEDIPTSQYLRVYDSVRHCWMRGYMVNGVMQWEVE